MKARLWRRPLSTYLPASQPYSMLLCLPSISEHPRCDLRQGSRNYLGCKSNSKHLRHATKRLLPLSARKACSRSTSTNTHLFTRTHPRTLPRLAARKRFMEFPPQLGRPIRQRAGQAARRPHSMRKRGRPLLQRPKQAALQPSSARCLLPHLCPQRPCHHCSLRSGQARLQHRHLRGVSLSLAPLRRLRLQHGGLGSPHGLECPHAHRRVGLLRYLWRSLHLALFG